MGTSGWGQVIATVLTAGGLGGALSWAVKGWFGRKRMDAEASHIDTLTEAEAAERLQQVSARIAEDAQRQIEAARGWAYQQVESARQDVERARRDADESRAAANQAWQAALSSQTEMLSMVTQWRRVVTEIRSPGRSWERLESLIGDAGPGLNGFIPSTAPR